MQMFFWNKKSVYHQPLSTTSQVMAILNVIQRPLAPIKKQAPADALCKITPQPRKQPTIVMHDSATCSIIRNNRCSHGQLPQASLIPQQIIGKSRPSDTGLLRPSDTGLPSGQCPTTRKTSVRQSRKVSVRRSKKADVTRVWTTPPMMLDWGSIGGRPRGTPVPVSAGVEPWPLKNSQQCTCQ